MKIILIFTLLSLINIRIEAKPNIIIIQPDDMTYYKLFGGNPVNPPTCNGSGCEGTFSDLPNIKSI